MTLLLRGGVALVAGLGLALCFEPVAVPWLLPLAVAGFAVATQGLRARVAWLPGLLFGAAFFFVHIWWLRASIGTGAWIALATAETVFYGLLGAVSPALQRLRGGPLWLACAWTAMETLRSTQPFSGMPWGRLAFAVVDTPVAPALSWVGMTGLGFVLALLGFLLARVVVADGGRARLLGAAGAVVVALLALAPGLAPARPDETGHIVVSVVQGGVPGRGDDVLADPEGLTDNHVRATLDLAADVEAGEVPRPDLVVWPENSTARDPFEPGPVRDGIERAVAGIGVPVVVGAIVDAGPEHVFNQGIVWDPRTGPGERYGKQNPVPWGEYIPFRAQMPDWFTETGQLARIPRDMIAGDRTDPLPVATPAGDVELADAICFDVVYDGGLRDQVENGADLLVVQTSNASYIFTDQVDQQFAVTRLRAIEAGRWLVVATTNGVSGVISPDGEVVATADRLDPAVLTERVGLVDGVTPGTRLGPWFATGTAAAAVGALALSLLAYRRRRTAGEAAVAAEPADAEREPAT